MKNFLIGLVYTVVLAGCLAHFSGCDLPEELSEFAALLTPEVAMTPTPGFTPDLSEGGSKDHSTVSQDTENSDASDADPAALISSTPTPKAKPTNAASVTGSPTSVPSGNTAGTTPGSSTAADKDNVGALLALIPSEKGRVDTEYAAENNFYYENEKEATKGLLDKCFNYSQFTMLYKDAGCMHTNEYFMSEYPEIVSLEIDYNESVRFDNGIYVVYNVDTRYGGKYSLAVRTGNTAYLDNEELTALKTVQKLSGELGLANMTDIEKVVTVHDYLINNTRYDSSYGEASHTPYGLLKNHKAVCDGYANTFLIFMVLNDVECNTVNGYANEPHAWNQVKIDGEWYNVDVTWDDPVTRDRNGKIVDNLRYTYLLVDDELLFETHVSQCSYAEECNSDIYHMLMYEEYICETEEDVNRQIDRQIDNDTIYFVCREDGFSDRDLLDIFQDNYNYAIRYYSPVEVREGWLLHEFINPLK